MQGQLEINPKGDTDISQYRQLGEVTLVSLTFPLSNVNRCALIFRNSQNSFIKSSYIYFLREVGLSAGLIAEPTNEIDLSDFDLCEIETDRVIDKIEEDERIVRVLFRK